MSVCGLELTEGGVHSSSPAWRPELTRFLSHLRYECADRLRHREVHVATGDEAVANQVVIPRNYTISAYRRFGVTVPGELRSGVVLCGRSTLAHAGHHPARRDLATMLWHLVLRPSGCGCRISHPF